MPLISFMKYIGLLQLQQYFCKKQQQTQFVLFAFRRFKWKNKFKLPKYQHRLLWLDMSTLEDKRTIARVCFVTFLTGDISSTSSLSEIKLKAHDAYIRYDICMPVPHLTTFAVIDV